MARPSEICPIHCLFCKMVPVGRCEGFTLCLGVMEGLTLASISLSWGGWTWTIWLVGTSSLGIGWAPDAGDGGLRHLHLVSAHTAASVLSFQASRRVLGHSLHLGDPLWQHGKCLFFHLFHLSDIYPCLFPPSPPC